MERCKNDSINHHGKLLFEAEINPVSIIRFIFTEKQPEFHLRHTAFG